MRLTRRRRYRPCSCAAGMSASMDAAEVSWASGGASCKRNVHMHDRTPALLNAPPPTTFSPTQPCQ